MDWVRWEPLTRLTPPSTGPQGRRPLRGALSVRQDAARAKLREGMRAWRLDPRAYARWAYVLGGQLRAVWGMKMILARCGRPLPPAPRFQLRGFDQSGIGFDAR